MVNIIVMVLSPLGDYLCLSNRDTVNLEEACPVKKTLFFFFTPQALQNAALI